MVVHWLIALDDYATNCLGQGAGGFVAPGFQTVVFKIDAAFSSGPTHGPEHSSPTSHLTLARTPAYNVGKQAAFWV